MPLVWHLMQGKACITLYYACIRSCFDCLWCDYFKHIGLYPLKHSDWHWNIFLNRRELVILQWDKELCHIISRCDVSVYVVYTFFYIVTCFYDLSSFHKTCTLICFWKSDHISYLNYRYIELYSHCRLKVQNSWLKLKKVEYGKAADEYSDISLIGEASRWDDTNSAILRWRIIWHFKLKFIIISPYQYYIHIKKLNFYQRTSNIQLVRLCTWFMGMEARREGDGCNSAAPRRGGRRAMKCAF